MAGRGLSRPFRNAEKGGGDNEGFSAAVSMQLAHSAAESCFARISGEYTALVRRRISASRTQSSESSSDLARPLNTWRTLNAWRGSQGKQNAPHGRGRGCRTDLHFEVFADLERVFRPFCSKCPLQQTARPLRSDSLEIHRSYRLDCAHSLCPSCPSLELALQDATPQQRVTASTHARPATRVRGSSHATNAAVQVLGQRMCGTWAAHVIAGPRAPRALFHTQTLLPASSACPHQRSPRCKGLRKPLLFELAHWLCRKKLDQALIKLLARKAKACREGRE